jgi:hypothetical protein
MAPSSLPQQPIQRLLEHQLLVQQQLPSFSSMPTPVKGTLPLKETPEIETISTRGTAEMP